MMRMERNTEQQDSALDALLRQAKPPAPPTNFSQNVWRQIRCSEPAPALSTTWGISWLPQVTAYSFAACLMIAALLLGHHLGNTQRVPQAEVQLPMLQPQTLAGIYLTTHAGR